MTDSETDTHKTEAELGAKLEEKIDKGYQALEVLEKGLTGRDFLVGGQYSLADISLSFADGLLFRRMEKLIDGEAPAVSLFSGPYYFAEQLGFRKVIDTTFMMASMITSSQTLRMCVATSVRCGGRSTISICARSGIPSITGTSFPSGSLR